MEKTKVRLFACSTQLSWKTYSQTRSLWLMVCLETTYFWMVSLPKQPLDLRFAPGYPRFRDCKRVLSKSIQEAKWKKPKRPVKETSGTKEAGPRRHRNPGHCLIKLFAGWRNFAFPGWWCFFFFLMWSGLVQWLLLVGGFSDHSNSLCVERLEITRQFRRGRWSKSWTVGCYKSIFGCPVGWERSKLHSWGYWSQRALSKVFHWRFRRYM